MKIGLIYCRKDQSSPMEMLENKLHGSQLDGVPSEFIDFLNSLAKEISLEGWTKYRGDSGSSTKTAFYDEWNNIESKFHVPLRW